MLAVAKQAKAIITAEEQSIIGGLGTPAVELLTGLGDSCVAFRRLEMNEEFCQQVGSQEYLRPIYGLSMDGITEVVRSLSEGGHK